MGVMVSIAADDHLDCGFYVEKACQFSDFSDIPGYLCSGDLHFCSQNPRADPMSFEREITIRPEVSG